MTGGVIRGLLEFCCESGFSLIIYNLDVEYIYMLDQTSTSRIGPISPVPNEV